MDALDLRILRETSRGRVMWWGSSDPRLSIREVARRLRVDVATISNRLRKWQRVGFLVSYSAVPNPLLLNAKMAGGGVRVPDPRLKERVLADLGLIEGAAFAIDQVGPWIVVMFVYETEGSLDRCSRLARRIPGVAEMEPCVPFRCPATTLTPSALDWRILDALHRNPRASIAASARTVGISTKTFARRYDALIRDNAVWSVPVLDFTRYEGATLARFIVRAAPDMGVSDVLGRLETRFPSYILLEDQSKLPESLPVPMKLFSLFLHLSSAGEVEDAELEIRKVPGVEDVEVYFPRRLHVYDHWFAERLEARGREEWKLPSRLHK